MSVVIFANDGVGDVVSDVPDTCHNWLQFIEGGFSFGVEWLQFGSADRRR